MHDYRYCQCCVLPVTYPGLRLNQAGICQFCLEAERGEKVDKHIESLKNRLDEAIAAVRDSKAQYVCIVAFSGGKDSSYTLKLLAKDYGLRCLAVTVDNGFLSNVALENIRAVTNALGVDHYLVKPSFSFMRRLFSESLKGGLHAPAAALRASDVCNSCISLINNQVLKISMQNNASLVAGGYLGGQVPRDAVAVDVDFEALQQARQKQVERYATRLGDEAIPYFSLPAAFPRLKLINPLLAVEYSEEQIIDGIRELGWKRPADTGAHSSNCLLNDVGIVAHVKKYGFHPYAFDLADLVRLGFMDRDEAIAKLEAVPDEDVIAPIADKLKCAE